MGYKAELAKAGPVIYRMGIFTCSVCAPNDMTPEEVAAAVSDENATWHPSTGPTFRGGEPQPGPCDLVPGLRTHYLFEC